MTGTNFFDFDNNNIHNFVVKLLVKLNPQDMGISQASIPMVKVNVENFLEPDNAHLDNDIDVLRHITRDDVKEMKKGQKRGRDDSDKTPWLKSCCSTDMPNG